MLNGLTKEEVEKRIAKGQYNGNFKCNTKSVSQILFTNIFTLFNGVNLCLALWVLSVHSYKNLTFMGVVFWNIVIGVFQELRARKTLNKLSIISKPHVTVIRDGKEEKIHSDKVVIDDICIISSGDQVCADGIVLTGNGYVDESLLTGESVPLKKSEGDKVFSGSFINEGTVTIKVTAVGEESYSNTIIKSTKYLKKNYSEIVYSIRMIIKIATFLIFPLAILLFIKQYFICDTQYSEAVISTVAAVIGMIPSGVVLLTSIVMATGVVKLATHNTLVQDLYSTEKLARVDTICFDKTGTITNGRITISKIINYNISSKKLDKLLSEFSKASQDRNATIRSIRVHYKDMKQEWEAQSVVPFSSEKKWSMVSFNGTDYILGAPEKLLGDKYAKFEEDFKEEYNNGARIVAFGEKKNSDIKILGIIILQDEIRENAPDTIKFFIEQGVDLKMISGDNALTTSIIAGKAGIKNAHKYCDVLTLNPEEIDDAIEKYTVFGRVTPEFKLAFVKALQNKGNIVAMTGDGVNDVMALKEADCSIAMQSGSDAARNISSLVLLDSDFAHLPEIVAEGRRSINNLERSSVLYLTKTIYAILLAFTFLFINYNYPFEPIQYTLIGAVAIGIPSFILAFEPNEERVKAGYLFHVLRKALPGGLLIATNIWLTVLMVYLRTGSETSVATMVTCSTGIASLMFLYDLCKPLNIFRAGLVIVLSAIFVIAIISAPGFFGTLGFTFMRIAGLLLIAVADYFIYMLYKKIILQKFTMNRFSSIIEKKFRLGGRRNGQN